MDIFKELGPNPGKFDIKNKFIAIEGIDGCGKTTLSKQLGAVIMAKTGGNSTRVHQPGYTKAGNWVRDLIKDNDLSIRPRTKHLLIEAARVDLLLQIETWRKTEPNLWIICDRHQDSSKVYQRVEGVPEDQIRFVQNGYRDLIEPDLTIFLDVDPGMAISRLWTSRLKEEMDSYDLAPIEFFEACRDIYHLLVKENREKYLVVDANQSEIDVLNSVTNSLKI